MLEGMTIKDNAGVEFVVCRVISNHLFEAVALDGKVETFRYKDQGEGWSFSDE